MRNCGNCRTIFRRYRCALRKNVSKGLAADNEQSTSCREINSPPDSCGSPMVTGLVIDERNVITGPI